ncbi:uncharacterized protein LOC125502099 [Athalia rosae]|uniref:uncharacterized protein LOC125502099 n=1 Tax=Athalia rosae TaxID=37344 RepID=UPI0020340BA4|nr:uncharacterized protein LOC125502099 [Athalia rosae]
MRIAEVAFLLLMNRVLAGAGGGKHHVHFRIHVPDVIKHHIHTKTVFVHVHGGGGSKKTPPKKKETHHEQSHREDWNAWSSYGSHGGHDRNHHFESSGFKDHEQSTHPYAQLRHRAHLRLPVRPAGVGAPGPHRNPGEHRQEIRGNDENVEVDPRGTLRGGGDFVGYSYDPPRYESLIARVPGDLGGVTELPGNEIGEPYVESYEEGYRKGHRSQTGHLSSSDLNNFYDAKFEEADALEQGYDDESFDNHGIAAESTRDRQSSGDRGADPGYYGAGDGYLRAE